jgi:hypothetical protein
MKRIRGIRKVTTNPTCLAIQSPRLPNWQKGVCLSSPRGTAFKLTQWSFECRGRLRGGPFADYYSRFACTSNGKRCQFCTEFHLGAARVDNTWLETMAQTLREELRISCTVVDIVVVDQDSEKLQTLEDAPWRLLVENMEWQYIDRCSTYVEELPFTRHDPTRWSCFIGGSQMWRQRTCACRLCHEYSAIPGSALVACHENGCL